MSKSQKFYSIFLCLIFLAFIAPIGITFAQTCTDGDSDGYGLNGDASCPNAGVDCDDTDANTHPDAPLLCDAKDNNCDGWIDFSTDKDVDGDGVPLCTHWQTGLKDCDDNNSNRFPGNIEIFGDPSCSDGIDNDCNNKTDSNDPKCIDQCNDSDGDGYGSPGHPSCDNPEEDCDDTNAAINPGADDSVCDFVDDDCDGTADDEYVPYPETCGIGICERTVLIQCIESFAPQCLPGLPEKEGALGNPTCSDTLDNDCDGTTDALDAGCQGPCLDDDGDGYGYYGNASCPNGSALDCNDDDPNINPGVLDDNCDNVDDNCSGTPDDEYVPPVTNCGVGECVTTGLLNCNAGVLEDDCTPLLPGLEGPFGDPTCDDLKDNDCDGDTDSLDNSCNPLNQDNDGDGYCEVGPCQNPANLGGDCDDTDLNTYPGAPQLCDAIDNDCDGWQDFFTDKDVDGDGVTLCTHWQTGLKDCDDNNANRFPGNIEVFEDPSCIDGIDNDCNNQIDSDDPKCLDQCNDSDGDGYGSPGHPSCPFPEEDCDDTNAAINPGATDTSCDGVDDNCSGTQDDEYVPTVTNCGVGECEDTGLLNCNAGVLDDDCTPLDPSKEGPSWHGTCIDGLDNDCDGLTDLVDPDPGCQGTCLDDDGDGYGYYGDASCPNGPVVDCDDDDPNINPGVPDDNCDNVDDNCSGTADDEYTPTVTNCGVGECATTGFMNCNAGVLEDDCSPLTPGTEGPFGDLTCEDTLDNDCDGDIDAGDNDCNPLDQDNDGDGYCEVGPCQNPANLDGDCDDTNPIVNPGGSTTICDAIDTNCDGWLDFYTDKDVDEDGVPLCTHWQTGLKDCDDNNANRFPGNIEIFGDPSCTDGIDNDCNNQIDDFDPKCLGPADVDGDGYCIPGHPSCTFPEEDCNDNNAAINPGAADDNCDAVDDNCSGTADDGYVETTTSCGVGACGSTGTLRCIGGEEVDDCSPGLPVKEGALGHPTCTDTEDNDCDTFTDASDPGCQTPCLDDDGDGYGHYGDASCPNGSVVDCDDDDPNINPGVPDDNCDNVDDNCSGTADDEYTPTVTNCGLGECATTGFMNCNVGVLEDDCTPLQAGVEDYLTPDVCTDTLDNDCDGLTDFSDPGCDPPDVDNDGDGYCEVGPCQNPANLDGDCDDTDPIVNPGGSTTICDAKDTNCDGWIDFFTDKDVDGDGVPLCEHWQTGLKDCDDNDPTRSPAIQEGPRDDPTCFDGFDNDCDNKTDNLDTDCAPPTCGTDPSPQDGPHMFDLLDGGDNVLKTPCQWCHFNDAGTVDERTKCERCHADPAWGGPDDGTLKALYPDPPPYGFDTATNVRLHSSTVLGTQYGAWDMDCLTCHNPHRQEQDNIYGTSYGKLIKEYICFDNTAIGGGNFEEIVEFTAATGPGSFADGPAPAPEVVEKNICQICHTQTNHHRNDGLAPGDWDGVPGSSNYLGHNDGGPNPCTVCHAHDEGFKPAGEADAPHNNTANPGLFDLCSVCHVSDTDFTTPVPSANCLNCHDEAAPLKAGGGSDIKVRSHFIGTMECIECHNPMFEQTNFRGNLNLSHIRTEVNGNQIAFEAKTGPFSFADDTNAAANGMLTENYICNTCHVDQNTNHHQADGTAPGGQSHNDGLDCTGCHTHQGGTVVPDAFRDHIEKSQAHDPHNNTYNNGQYDGLFDNCSVCHVSESDFVTPVPSANCLVCHDGTPATHVASHFVGTMECIECHNPMREQINKRDNPNLSLIRTSINGTDVVLESKTGQYGFAANGDVPADMTLANYICNTCHTQTNHHQADGTAPLGQAHNNGENCTAACHTHLGSFTDQTVKIADQPHNTALFNDNCNLCHVDGVVPQVPIPNTKCQGCHAVGTPDQAGGGANKKVETHHTPGDRDCVECHNPMGAQGGNAFHIRLIVNGAPIVFTASNDYAFGDGTGLCEVCHTSNTHYVNVANQPAQFPNHNVGSNCTTADCHTHDTGMAPPGVADVPHDTITDCTLCHDPGTYVDGATLDNNKCLGCHGPAGPATTVKTHHTPADLNCTDCHNPMNVTGTWRHIKPTVDGSTLVSFGNPTTPATGGEYADGLGNGLCEVCHDSLTLSYYNSDGSGASHNDGSVCTSCHTHDTGMAPPGVADVPHDGITDCTLCHDEGTYVDGATLSNIKCLGCHGPAGPATTVETHHTPADLNCTDCHNPMNATGTWRHIKPTVDGSTLVSFGNPTTPATGGEYADGNGNGLCEVCHDSLTLSYYNSDGSGAAHMTDVCTTCHTHDTGMAAPITPIADTPHDTITDCTQCHSGDDYADGATLDNNKCLGCHGPAGPATTVETHHTPADLNCTDCHNPMNVTGTWRHIKPTVDGSAITFGNPTTAPSAAEYADGNGNGLCEVCHDSLTLSYYNSDGSGAAHMTDVCTTCHTHDTGMAAPITPIADTPHDTITDCTQCHSGDDYADGATLDNNKCLGCHGPAGPATTVETHHTPADLNCTDCHNPMNVTGTWRHIKPTVDGSALVSFGNPTIPATGGEYADGNGNGLCEVCHDALTLSYYNSDGSGAAHNDGDICTTCHTHPTGFASPTGVADEPHDTITECTLCHSGNDYADGATLDNNKCLGCHGPAGPATTVETHHTPADLNCTDCHNPMNVTGTWRHIKPTVDGSTLVSFGNPTTPATAGEYADGLGNGLCEVCHDSLTLSYYNSDGSGAAHMTDVCTTCHTHDTGMVAPITPIADTPHDTITDCTQCHSGDDYVDGATLDNNKCLGCHGPAGPATTAETHHTPADLNCTDCHNPMNVTGTWRHIKPTVDGSTLVSFGNPTTPATGGEYADGNGNGLCEVCHDSLTLSYYNSDGSGAAHMTDVCTTCHTHDTGMAAPITPIADTPHETITDCTLCHSGNDYADGATLDNNKCLGCHGPAGPATTVETHHTPADLNCTDCHNPMNVTGTWRHIKPTVDGSTLVSFGNPTTPATGGEYADGNGNGLCEVCHDSLTLSYYNSDGSGAAHMTDVCTTCHTHDTGMAAPITPIADTPHDTITDCTQCHSGDDYADGATLDNNKCLGCHGPAGPATTVETHHTPADLNCTDCHNPMFSQGSNLSHIRTTLAAFTANAAGTDFADGSGTKLCETCHAGTTYYNDAGTGTPHMTDVCTGCHTHDTGFTPPDDPADTPHNGITDCTLCHDGDDYAAGDTLDNDRCLVCHGPGGTATETAAHHAPLGTNCTDCHNVMRPQTNASHIKPSIVGATGSVSVTFGGTDYVSSPQDGSGLCEICHTTTLHWKSDGTGTPHHDTGCTAAGCHPHADGFPKPLIDVPPPHDTFLCVVCHAAEPDYAAPIENTECLSCHDEGAPGAGTLYDYSACRTESAVTSIPNGQPSATITLGTAIADINQAFLLLDSAGGAAVENGQDHMVSGDIISTTQVQFDRTGTTGQVDISYAVVECKNNEFSVESGEILLGTGTTTNTAALTTAVDPARSIVLVSTRSNIPTTEQFQAHATGELINNGADVRVTRATGADDADTDVTFQVVEFSISSGVTVQTGETTLGSDQQSATASVSVPVLSDAWLYFSYDATDEGPQQTAVSGRITDSTTLTFERHANNLYTNRIRWYVVTFPTGEVTVQRGSSVFSGSSTTHNIGFGGVAAINNAFTFVSNTTADTGDTGGGGPTVKYFRSNAGSGTYGGITVTNTVCTNTDSGLVGILSENAGLPGASGCNSGRINVDSANLVSTWVFTTTYASDTTIDGGTVNFHFEERDNSSETVQFDIGYVMGGSFTSLGFATQNITSGSDTTYTINLVISGGVAPSGSVLALQLTNTASTRDRMSFLGTGNGAISMTITETGGGTPTAYPINRWTEVLSSTSNIQLTNGRGTETDSNADFEWQVVEFTGSGPVSGNGADKKVDTHTGDDYLVNLDCVECHNPMTAQTNLSFIRDTLRGNPVVFTDRNNMADGAAPYDGVCEVCHTQTLHYRNDNSSPSMPHNPGTICTDCHLHLNSENGGGFDKNAVPAAPHNTGTFLTDCFLCHVTAMPYSTPIPQTKCEQCHDTAGVLRSENGGSGEFDAASIVQTHSSNACLDCHEPMWGTSNIFLVLETLTGSIDPTSVIEFTALSGPGSFSDGDSPYKNNICDTCHSQTDYHRYDGNAPIDQDHNINTDCTITCHPHSVGFQPDIAVPFPHDTQLCNTCHTAEPDYATPVTNSACLSCHDGTGSTLIVDRHYSTKYDDPLTGQPMDLECVECHNPMTAQTNLVFIRDTLRGNTVVFTAYTGTNSFADGNSTYDGVCEVCHTQTNHHRNDGSAPQQSHNDGQDCRSCHDHLDGYIPAVECVVCHTGIPTGGPGYVLRDVVGSDFTQASRHVFGGTVSNWDCIVCHREGDAVAAASGNIALSGVHSNAQVEMRDVDSIDATTIATDGPPVSLVWDKGIASDTMFTAMDYFCMSCHDSDGASGINVNATDDGVNLTNVRALTPFNTSDGVSSTGTQGGTVWQGEDASQQPVTYERTRVLDVFTQFDSTNPSHHAVRGQAYSDTSCNVYPGDCWGSGAWVSNALKSGQALTTVLESASLHCADCHTVDSADGGAHGGASGFMLQASSIDGTCYLCHNSNVYSDNSSTLTRWSHDSEGSVWGDHALIGNYDGNPGSTCLNCHGGKIGEGGSFVGYDGYGGIHGMSGTDSRSGQIKYRFQGGAYMAHDPGTAGWTGSGGTDWGCYFAGNSDQDWSTCNKHSGGGGNLLNNGSRDMAPQYDRGTPGQY